MYHIYMAQDQVTQEEELGRKLSLLDPGMTISASTLSTNTLRNYLTGVSNIRSVYLFFTPLYFYSSDIPH